MKRLVTAIILLVALGRPGTAEETPRLALPLMKSAPVIDGVIHEEEWSGAARMMGFVNARAGLLADREAVFWVGCDGRRLLLAVKSEMPPGDTLLTRAVPDAVRDNQATFHDDGVELFVDPHRGQTTGDRRYFQIATNARGALYDCAFDPANRAQRTDQSWRVQWQFANRVVDGYWHVEIGIPLESLGAAPADLLHSWGLRVGRNWARPAEATRWEMDPVAYDDLPSMPVVTWEKDAPVVQMLGLRDGGKVALRVRVANPGPASLAAAVLLSNTWSSNPPRELRETAAIAPGGSREFTLTPDDGGNDGPHRTLVRVASADGRRAFYVREFRWKLARGENRWTVGEQARQTVNLQFKVYPSLGKIKVRADITALPAAGRVSGGEFRVLRKGSAKPVAVERARFRGGVAEQVFDAPLGEGDYTLALLLEGGQGVPKEAVTGTFQRRVFPWENNRLGISDEVIPPFTPLVLEGRRLGCVLREHTFGDAGLWDQVRSQGRPLLAAPMSWEVVAGEGPVAVRGEGWKADRAAAAEVTGTAAWSAGGLRASVRTQTDYDGMTRFTLTLPRAAGTTLQRLSLVVPLVDSEAGYLHACGDQLRNNYAGAAPGGSGRVWDSSKANRTELVGTFYPYVWLGGGERGMAWFADGDRDWSLDEKTPTCELFRERGILSLRVNFITRPTALTRARHIEFGLQATPVKPMPEGWRRWQFGLRVPGTPWNSIVGATLYYGGFFYDPYPAGHDLTIYRKLNACRQSGRADMAYADQWLAAHLPKGQPGPVPYEMMRVHIRAGLHGAAATPRSEGWRVAPYTNLRGMGFHLPEWQTFQDEWHNFSYYHRPTAGNLGYDLTPSRSLQDFLLWSYREMGEVFDGVYWDNVFLAARWDDVVGGAWVDEQGRMHPGMGLWAMRDLIKRTAVLYHQMGRAGLFIPHMTNCSLIPVNAFANVTLDWEWKYGYDDFQDRFAPELTVAETIGRQTGAFPLILAGGHLDPKDPRTSRAWRTRLGVCLVHEIRAWASQPASDAELYGKVYAFGYGAPDCRVFNYWEQDHPLRVEGIDARTIALARGGRAVLIVTDYGGGGQARVRFDAARLGLNADARARDLETGAAIALAAQGVLTLDVKKHDFKAIVLGGER